MSAKVEKQKAGKSNSRVRQLEAELQNVRAELRETIERHEALTEDARAVREKLVEEELRESEERLKLSAEAGRIGNWQIDLTTDTLGSSAICKANFGLAANEDLSFERFFEILHADDRDRVRAAIEKAVETGTDYDTEYRVVWSDDSVHWIVARGRAFYAADGTPLRMLGVTQNITERKETEQRLRKSEKRFRSYFELGLIGMAITSPTKGVLEVNDEICKILGYERSELLQMNWAEITHPDDLAADVAEFNRVMAGEIDGYKLDKCWIRKDGRIIDTTISVKALHRADGSVEYFVALLEDVTESKRFETLLGAQKRALEMVVGGSPLTEVLAYLASIVERQSANSSIASLMLLDERGRLHNGAAPSLPADFIQALEGIEADESIGTCSRAAATGKAVITPDIAADPQWQDLKHLPLGLGLQSAWSMPVVAADGRVLGTFGTYFREKREPPGFERETVEILCGTAALAIQRKRAEEALRESEAKYRTLFDSIDEGYCLIEMIYDSQGEPVDYRFLETNRAFERHNGFTGVVGKTALELVPDLEKHWFEIYGRVARTGEAVRLENNVAPINRWFDVYAVRVGAGSGQVAVVFRDITERKRAEERLRTSEEWLRQATEAGQVFVWEIDLLKQTAKFSDNVERVLGFRLPTNLEDNFNALHPEDRERQREVVERAIATGGRFDEEHRISNPSGGASVWVRASGAVVVGADGRPVRLVGTTRNISERKQAEEALQKAKDELEHRVMKRTSQLSELNENLKKEIEMRERVEDDRERLLRRVVSAQEDEQQRIAREMHDQFGQNLSALALKLSALKNDYEKQPELNESFARLEAIVKQLDADVDFLVRELRPTALDDFGLVVAVSNYIKNWSKHFGIRAELHTIGMGKDRLTHEIETALYRVTQEALTNVAKHARAENVDVILERRSDSVSVLIEDDGIGFDAEQAFGANEKGFGLIGMRERAGLAGGVLRIESGRGRGATIVVRIPAAHVSNGVDEDE